MNDVWIYAIPAEWDAVDTTGQPWANLFKSAVTGYWKTLVDGTTVYNVVGHQTDIEELIEALGTVVKGSDWWEQGTGLDVLEPVEHRTDTDRVLSYMNDHVTYDETGAETSRIPATFDDPNWGHCFLGQKVFLPGANIRIFAGEFNPDQFSEEYL